MNTSLPLGMPGWCPCGARAQLVLGFEGWVPVCGRCGGYARRLAEIQEREEAKKQHRLLPPQSEIFMRINAMEISDGGVKESSKTSNLFRRSGRTGSRRTRC